MKNNLVFIFLCFSATLSAQVPGFMGKRFTIFLEANPTPAVFVQNANNTVTVSPGGDARTEDVNRFAFNFRPQATVEYLVHRDISIGLSYSRLSVGTIRGFKRDPDFSTEFTINQDVIKGQAAGLHIKLYQFDNSASVAPIGFYQIFSGYLTQSNTYDTKSSKTKQFKNDFVYPVATFAFGRQSMIAKNLIFKTSVELGWSFVPSNFYQETEQDWDDQEFSGYNVHQSLFAYYVFSINVALGYTLF
jgi:hypothetical protein